MDTRRRFEWTHVKVIAISAKVHVERNPWILRIFQFEKRSRTTCSPFLQSFALPDEAVKLRVTICRVLTGQHSTRQQRATHIQIYIHIHIHIHMSKNPYIHIYKSIYIYMYTYMYIYIYIYIRYHDSSKKQPQLEWKCDAFVLCMLFVCVCVCVCLLCVGT